MPPTFAAINNRYYRIRARAAAVALPHRIKSSEEVSIQSDGAPTNPIKNCAEVSNEADGASSHRIKTNAKVSIQTDGTTPNPIKTFEKVSNEADGTPSHRIKTSAQVSNEADGAQPVADVMNTIFRDCFPNFRRQKWIFQENQCFDQFCIN
jgi:hypothetical protein